MMVKTINEKLNLNWNKINEIRVDMDFKEQIIDNLQLLCKNEAIAKERFKVRAYQKVITQLKTMDKITSIEDIKNVVGVGIKIKTKIEEIIKTGELKSAEKIKKSKTLNTINSVDELMQIHGIGIVTAQKLIDSGIHNIKELIENEKKVVLSVKQKVGLEYYKDINNRISRSIMDKHNKHLTKIFNKYSGIVDEFAIVGSYRRGAKDCGDIDLLVRSENPGTLIKVVKLLKEEKYIQADLANGRRKYMGIVKLKGDDCARRFDILITNKKEYPFALLYFTGNDLLNIELRKCAQAMGYSLNEYSLVGCKKSFKTEKEIFRYLGYKYIEPHDRNECSYQRQQGI